MNQIISGCDASWNRLDNAGTCGFGDNLPSLDDLVSKKLMGETKGASENLSVCKNGCLFIMYQCSGKQNLFKR